MTQRVNGWVVALLYAVAAALVAADGDGPALHVVVHYPSSRLASLATDPHNHGGVFVRGDGLGLTWDSGLELEAAGEDTWSVALPIPHGAPGSLLHFKILVDDSTWQIGANEVVVVPKASAAVDVYPWFATAAGRYEYVRNVYSPQLLDYRDLVVYLPPSYDENPLKHYSSPIIMHDGQNLFNASTSFGGIAWQCQDTVNELVNEGNMREVLIVGIDNNANRTAEYTYSRDPDYGGGNAEAYLDFVEQTVIPLATKRYRVAAVEDGPGRPPQRRRQPEHVRGDAQTTKWGMIGSSLGGLLSCYAGWTRSATFDTVGCMSSSFWWNSQDFNGTVLRHAPGGGVPRVQFYLDSGDSGPGGDDRTETLTVHAHLEAYGYEPGSTLFYYLDRGGMHNERYWGARFHVPMAALYPPAVSPTRPGVPTAAP